MEIIINCADKIQEPAVSYQIINNDNIPIIHELVLNSEQKFGEDKGIYKLTSIISNLNFMKTLMF